MIETYAPNVLKGSPLFIWCLVDALLHPPSLDLRAFCCAIGGCQWLVRPQFAITPFPNIASSMKAPSGESSEREASTAEESPKAAVLDRESNDIL